MNKLLSIQEVQDLLQVRRNWIYERIKSGELKRIKLGRLLRFKREDVEALVTNTYLKTERGGK